MIQVESRERANLTEKDELVRNTRCSNFLEEDMNLTETHGEKGSLQWSLNKWD